MMNSQDVAFSIAVALPNYLKPLVERMLQSVLHEPSHRGCSWYLSDMPGADVTLRLKGDGTQAISPSLLAEVRCRDGRVETVSIDGPWRTGAMAAAFARIGTLLQASPQRDKSGIALECLQRWTALRARDLAEPVELCIGGHPVALLDTRQVTMHARDRDICRAPEALIEAMARDGWSLGPATSTAWPPSAPMSIKPLLWKLGLYAGSVAALPALQSAATLRLKGWPYLAAGGHRSFAELINALRGRGTNRASLHALGLAPRAVVDGFLNACLVCEFFHDTHGSEQLPRVPAMNSGANLAIHGNPHVAISAIRRSLGMGSS